MAIPKRNPSRHIEKHSKVCGVESMAGVQRVEDPITVEGKGMRDVVVNVLVH